MKKIIEFFKEVKKELKLVNWPTKSDIKEGTLVVILISGIVAIFLAVIDFVIGYLINYVV